MSRADKGGQAAHTECPVKVDGVAEVATDMFGKNMEHLGRLLVGHITCGALITRLDVKV